MHGDMCYISCVDHNRRLIATSTTAVTTADNTAATTGVTTDVTTAVTTH